VDLTALAAQDERKGKGVELGFFGGLSVDETPEVLNFFSLDSVSRHRLSGVRGTPGALLRAGGEQVVSVSPSNVTKPRVSATAS